MAQPRIQNDLPASELMTLAEVRARGFNNRSIWLRAQDGRIAIALIGGRAYYKRSDVELEVSILNACLPNRSKAGWFGDHSEPDPNSRFRTRVRRKAPAPRPQQVFAESGASATTSPATVADEGSP